MFPEIGECLTKATDCVMYFLKKFIVLAAVGLRRLDSPGSNVHRPKKKNFMNSY